uniref:Uncharacterized protein n=1 Tax=Arundo donax TaxID=35708 RepID=A0A0A9GDJ1_ARUDO
MIYIFFHLVKIQKHANLI